MSSSAKELLPYIDSFQFGSKANQNSTEERKQNIMLPKQEIQELGESILVDQKTIEPVFLEKVTKSQIEYLFTRGWNYWQNYGAYWYNFSDVLNKYAPKEFREYARAANIDLENVNEDVKKVFDFGSDMNNWVAGMEFLEWRYSMQELNGEHQWIEMNGDLKEFSLISGFIESEPDYQIENDVSTKEVKLYERDIEAMLIDPQGMTAQQADEADDRARDEVANSTYLTTQNERNAQSENDQLELDFNNKKQNSKK